MKYFPLLLSLAGAFSAHAATIITFDLESSTATFSSPPSSSRPGALTSLLLTNSGVSLTITRQNGTAFDLVSNTGDQSGKPASWGNISLDPFFDPSNSGWIFTFSQPVFGFSVQLGDYGQDADTATLTAYSGPSGTGTNLASSLDNYSTQALPVFDTASVAANGTMSVTLNGTSDSPGFNNSVFLDNIVLTMPSSVTTVPEPRAATLLLGGFVTLLLFGRRKHGCRAV
jgi:hypothetical protein